VALYKGSDFGRVEQVSHYLIPPSILTCGPGRKQSVLLQQLELEVPSESGLNEKIPKMTRTPALG
jgi:hypothetical protein